MPFCLRTVYKTRTSGDKRLLTCSAQLPPLHHQKVAVRAEQHRQLRQPTDIQAYNTIRKSFHAPIPRLFRFKETAYLLLVIHPPSTNIMAILNTIQTLICSAPVHLVCFFALLGTELHQSLITAKKYFHALRRDKSLASHGQVSPVLLRAQSILLILVAVTVPSRGLLSLIEHKSSWIPLLVGSYATALNVFLFHPRASRALNDLQLQSKSFHLRVGRFISKSNEIRYRKHFRKSQRDRAAQRKRRYFGEELP